MVRRLTTSDGRSRGAVARTPDGDERGLAVRVTDALADPAVRCGERAAVADAARLDAVAPAGTRAVARRSRARVAGTARAFSL